MAELPPSIIDVLGDPVYRRADPDKVKTALRRLGCIPKGDFVSFYEKYAGPFSSDTTGDVLLDVIDQEPNIESLTMTGRSEYGFPGRYLVLTDLFGGEVLVYDCDTDAVFEVDFEGGEQELISGTLQPRWSTFVDFLTFYFHRVEPEEG